MWECRIGIEGVRSVPLEEWTVIWKGEKELQTLRVSGFFTQGLDAAETRQLTMGCGIPRATG